MTKAELIKSLQDDPSPDDIEIVIWDTELEDLDYIDLLKNKIIGENETGDNRLGEMTVLLLANKETLEYHGLD